MTPSDPTQNNKPSALTTLLAIAAFVIVVAGLKAAQALIVPFLLAAFVAVVCAPALLWLEEHGLPRALAMIVVIAAIVGAAFGFTALVSRSIRDFTRDLPTYKARIAEEFGSVLQWAQSKGLPVTREDIVSVVDPAASIQLAADVFNGFGGVLANAFLIFLTAVFILFETSTFPTKLRAMVDRPEQSMAEFSAFTQSLRRYLAIKSVVSLGTGASIMLCLMLIGVDYPVLWGILAFLLNYVPNIGSIIAAVPTIALALVQLGPVAAMWTGTSFLAVNLLFGNVIEPRYLGEGLGLSTLVVFLSLVFWGWVLGPVGMFLSVPLTMTAKIAFDSHDGSQWLAVVLGSGREAANRAREREQRAALSSHVATDEQARVAVTSSSDTPSSDAPEPPVLMSATVRNDGRGSDA